MTIHGSDPKYIRNCINILDILNLGTDDILPDFYIDMDWSS